MLRLRVAKASRAHASRARVTQRCCVYLLSHLSHTLSQGRSFSTHFPHFFSAKSNLHLLSHPSLSPQHSPFVLVNPLFRAKIGTFSTKCGTFSAKSRTFSRKQRTFFEKSWTFSAKSRQETHRLKPTFGTIFHIPSVKSTTFAKKNLYPLKIKTLPQQCDRCDSKKQ